MKKEIKTKKITINELAGTVDKLAIMTKNGFDRIDKKLNQHDKIFDLMIKELKTIHEDNKYFRQNISNLNIDGSSYNRRIENLTVRVEHLETKRKENKYLKWQTKK